MRSPLLRGWLRAGVAVRLTSAAALALTDSWGSVAGAAVSLFFFPPKTVVVVVVCVAHVIRLTHPHDFGPIRFTLYSVCSTSFFS